MDIDSNPETAETEPAEYFDIPTEKYLAVEFPGYVQNLTNALETLGGLQSLEESHADREATIPLKFRPKDPWCHPIFLDRQLTSSFILEIQEKYDPKTNKLHKTGSLIGTVPHTYAYKGLADYQYLPPSLSNDILEPSKEKNPFKPSSTADQQELPPHWPPPIFSKSDQPHIYQFESNPYFQLVEQTDTNGKTEKVFIKTRNRQPLEENLPLIQFETEGVPSVPPAKTDVRPVPDLVEIYKSAFSDQEVYPKHILDAMAQSSWANHINASLYQVAYSFTSGPWRNCYCKLGYDPRTHPEARIYQIIDFRVKDHSLRGKPLRDVTAGPTDRPRRMGNSRRTKVMEGDGPIVDDDKKWKEHYSKTSYELRFKKPPSRKQTLYFVRELEIPEVQKLLEKPPATECTKEYGWFTPSVAKQIRVAMVQHNRELIAHWDSLKPSERVAYDGDHEPVLEGELGDDDEEDEDEEDDEIEDEFEDGDEFASSNKIDDDVLKHAYGTADSDIEGGVEEYDYYD